MNSLIKQISESIGIESTITIVIFVLIYFAKRFLENRENSYKTRTEQLDKLLKFFQDETIVKNCFLYEEVFVHRFGTYIPYEVIELLMKCKNPTYALTNYAKGKNLLKLTRDGDLIIYKYWSIHFYTFIVLHFAMYIIAVFMTYFILMVSLPSIDYSNNTHFKELVMHVILCIATSALIYLSLDKISEYLSAKNVVHIFKHNQKEFSSNSIL